MIFRENCQFRLNVCPMDKIMPKLPHMGQLNDQVPGDVKRRIAGNMIDRHDRTTEGISGLEPFLPDECVSAKLDGHTDRRFRPRP